MIAEITHNQQKISINLSQPIDISLPIIANDLAAKAWHAATPKMEPVVAGDWIGEVKSGAPVNFRNVFFNPHGNGTHTECVGHITPEIHSVNQGLKQFHFLAQLITIDPEKLPNGDLIITKNLLGKTWKKQSVEAIIIRTLPNHFSKKNTNYSDTNPPYLTADVADFLHEKGIQHLLIDLPSVDKEWDNGVLQMHHLFWNYPAEINLSKTITELIYVPNEVEDGIYFLNLMIAAFENDAAPSKPVLYKINEI